MWSWAAEVMMAVDVVCGKHLQAGPKQGDLVRTSLRLSMMGKSKLLKLCLMLLRDESYGWDGVSVSEELERGEG